MASGRKIKPKIPAKKPKSMTAGMIGRIRILANKPKMEIKPILYKINGRTNIWVETVATTNSRNLYFSVIKVACGSKIGEISIKAKVDKKDSWKEMSNTNIFGF